VEQLEARRAEGNDYSDSARPMRDHPACQHSSLLLLLLHEWDDMSKDATRQRPLRGRALASHRSSFAGHM